MDGDLRVRHGGHGGQAGVASCGCSSRASTTSAPSPGTRGATSTSTRASSGSASSRDGQPGRPQRLPPLRRRRGGPPGGGPDLLRVPPGEAGPCGRRDDPSHRPPRRLAGVARVLGRPAAGRGRRRRARRGRRALRGPRDAWPRARGRHERRSGRSRPRTRRSRRITAARPRGRPRLQRRARPLRGAPGARPRGTSDRTTVASSCAATCAAAGSPSIPRRPSPDARARASSTTSRGGPTTPTCPPGSSGSTQTRLPNSGSVDRHYFHSLYVREPGGVLYELATQEPGFLVDGLSVEELGGRIILPPFLEDRRAEVEARLTPLPDPRAGLGYSHSPAIAPDASAPR